MGTGGHTLGQLFEWVRSRSCAPQLRFCQARARSLAGKGTIKTWTGEGLERARTCVIDGAGEVVLVVLSLVSLEYGTTFFSNFFIYHFTTNAPHSLPVRAAR